MERKTLSVDTSHSRATFSTAVVPRGLSFFLLTLLLIFSSCRQPFSITDVLDTPENSVVDDTEPLPLFINPSTVTLYIGSSLQFVVSGGTAPYTYSVSSGSGSVNAYGVYTAPGTAGSAVLTVSDSTGDAVSADITITDTQLNADYLVQSISNSPATAQAGSVLAQTFTYSNQGSEPGFQTVFWNAYTSTDTILDGADVPIDGGQVSFLGASAVSADVNIDGVWPASAGVWYIIVKVSSGDDKDPSNNYTASAPFTITSLAGDIDYQVLDITRNYPTVNAGSLCSEKFSLTNTGGSSGGQDVSWNAYASLDTTIDGSDTLIDSGTTGLLDSGATRTGIAINGYWPGTAGTYYILVSVSSGDETVTTNNVGSRSGFTLLSPPDYEISSVSYGGNGVANTLFGDNGTFSMTLAETKGNAGNQPLGWKVYVSFDSVLDGSDIKVLEGTTAALAGNGSKVISFESARWPVMGSHYTIIITINAGDDSDTSNNTYVSPGTVYVPELYTEDSTDNSAVGPTLTAASAVSDLSGAISGTKLSVNQLIQVNGFMDGAGAYDTYMLQTDSATTRLELYVTWSTNADDMNFYIWDEGATAWASEDTRVDSEPLVPTPPAKYTVVPNTRYFIGVKTLNAGKTDTPYTLFIQGK